MASLPIWCDKIVSVEGGLDGRIDVRFSEEATDKAWELARAMAASEHDTPALVIEFLGKFAAAKVLHCAAPTDHLGDGSDDTAADLELLELGIKVKTIRKRGAAMVFSGPQPSGTEMAVLVEVPSNADGLLNLGPVATVIGYTDPKRFELYAENRAMAGSDMIPVSHLLAMDFVTLKNRLMADRIILSVVDGDRFVVRPKGTKLPDEIRSAIQRHRILLVEDLSEPDADSWQKKAIQVLQAAIKRSVHVPECQFLKSDPSDAAAENSCRCWYGESLRLLEEAGAASEDFLDIQWGRRVRGAGE